MQSFTEFLNEAQWKQGDWVIMNASDWLGRKPSLAMIAKEEPNITVLLCKLKCGYGDKVRDIYLLSHSGQEKVNQEWHPCIQDTGLGHGKRGEIQVVGKVSIENGEVSGGNPKDRRSTWVFK